MISTLLADGAWMWVDRADTKLKRCFFNYFFFMQSKFVKARLKLRNCFFHLKWPPLSSCMYVSMYVMLFCNLSTNSPSFYPPVG